MKKVKEEGAILEGKWEGLRDMPENYKVELHDRDLILFIASFGYSKLGLTEQIQSFKEQNIQITANQVKNRVELIAKFLKTNFDENNRRKRRPER